MARFDDALVKWKEMNATQKAEDAYCSAVVAEGDWKKIGTVVSVLLLDVVRVVEAYERTIADLKRQNKKARGRREKSCG